jgi:hypothetical protein
MFLPFAFEIAGAILALFALHEVFRDIFHPTLSGNLSDWLGRMTALLLRHTFLRPAVGPIVLVSTILCWVMLLACGFAFIFYGLSIQDLIKFQGPPTNSLWTGLFRCIYLSFGALDTFQTFDTEIRPDWLRLLITIEGLIGLSMITASVSWLVLLYPALARTRFFAKRISLLARAEQRVQLSLVQHLGAPVLTELTRGIIQLRLDFILFPILFNFYASDQSASIAFTLPELSRIANDGTAENLPSEVRLAAAQLQVALEELGKTLARESLGVEYHDTESTFKAFQNREQ